MLDLIDTRHARLLALEPKSFCRWNRTPALRRIAEMYWRTRQITSGQLVSRTEPTAVGFEGWFHHPSTAMRLREDRFDGCAMHSMQLCADCSKVAAGERMSWRFARLTCNRARGRRTRCPGEINWRISCRMKFLLAPRTLKAIQPENLIRRQIVNQKQSGTFAVYFGTAASS